MRLALVWFLFLSNGLNCQDSKSKINFEIYGDFFVNGTFNNQPSHKISEIIYNHNRTNEFALNLGYLKSYYTDTNFRYNLSFMLGSYAMDNLASEDPMFRNIMEANVGYKISKHSNVWLDAGVMNSHIGYESALSYDAWNITRSLIAENTPFYETGVKITHTTQNGKFSQSYMLLNGWQRINMLQGHSIPAIGMQFVFKPNDNIQLNYSNFFGSIRPDSIWALKTHHNIFGAFDLSKKWSLFADFDLGSDKNSLDEYALWYAGILGARYKINPSTTLAYRIDFLHDAHDVLYPELKYNWLVWANTINLDRQLNQFSKLRFELKYMNSSDPLFLYDHSEYLGAFLALQIKI